MIKWSLSQEYDFNLRKENVIHSIDIIKEEKI